MDNIQVIIKQGIERVNAVRQRREGIQLNNIDLVSSAAQSLLSNFGVEDTQYVHTSPNMQALLNSFSYKGPPSLLLTDTTQMPRLTRATGSVAIGGASEDALYDHCDWLKSPAARSDPISALSIIESAYNAKYDPANSSSSSNSNSTGRPITDNEALELINTYTTTRDKAIKDHNSTCASTNTSSDLNVLGHDARGHRAMKTGNISCPLDTVFGLHSEQEKFAVFAVVQETLCAVQGYIRSKMRGRFIARDDLVVLIQDGSTALTELHIAETPGFCLIHLWLKCLLYEFVKAQLGGVNSVDPLVFYDRLRWQPTPKVVDVLHHAVVSVRLINIRCLGALAVLQNEVARVLALHFVNTEQQLVTRSTLDEEMFTTFLAFRAHTAGIADFKVTNDDKNKAKRGGNVYDDHTDEILDDEDNNSGSGDSRISGNIWKQRLHNNVHKFWVHNIVGMLREGVTPGERAEHLAHMHKLSALFPEGTFPESMYTELLTADALTPRWLYRTFECLGFKPIGTDALRLADFTGHIHREQKRISPEMHAEWVLCLAALTSINTAFANTLYFVLVTSLNAKGCDGARAVEARLHVACQRMLGTFPDGGNRTISVDKLKFHAVAETVIKNFAAFLCKAVCSQITRIVPSRLIEFMAESPSVSATAAKEFCCSAAQYYTDHVKDIKDASDKDRVFHELLENVAALLPTITATDDVRILPLIARLDDAGSVPQPLPSTTARTGTTETSSTNRTRIEVLYKVFQCTKYANSFQSKSVRGLRNYFIRAGVKQETILREQNLFATRDASVPWSPLLRLAMNDLAYAAMLGTLSSERTNCESVERYADRMECVRDAEVLPIAVAYLFEHGTLALAKSLERRNFGLENVPRLDGFFAYMKFATSPSMPSAVMEPLAQTGVNIERAREIFSAQFTTLVVNELISRSVAHIFATHEKFNHFCQLWDLSKLLTRQYDPAGITERYTRYANLYVRDLAESTPTPFLADSRKEETTDGTEAFARHWNKVVAGTPQGKARWLEQEWQWLQSHLEYISKAISWLRRQGFPVAVAEGVGTGSNNGGNLSNDVDGRAKDLVQARDEYRAKVCAFQPFQANKLVHFFARDSKMFIFKFENETTKMRMQSSSGGTASIGAVFERTLSFFRKLFVFRELRYADANEILDIFQRYPAMLADEVKIFTDSAPFCAGLDVPVADLAESGRIVTVLGIVAEIGGYKARCDNLVNVAQSHTLLSPSVLAAERARLAAVLGRIVPEMPITAVQDIEAALRDVIGGISLTELDFFYHADVYSGLYPFFEKLCAYEDYAKREALVRSFHKNLRESAILNSLVSVRSVYEQIIAFARESNSRNGGTLKDLCDRVAGEVRKTNARSLYAKMETVNNETVTLSAWFGNPKGGQILTGVYESRLPGGLFLRCNNSNSDGSGGDEGIVYNAAYVSEVVHRSVVFDKKMAGRDIDEYSAYNATANAFHAVIVELESLGHPDYQAPRVIEINRRSCSSMDVEEEGKGGSEALMTLTEFQAALMEAQTKLHKWKEFLQRLVGEETIGKRLKFLNAKQLLQFGRVLENGADKDIVLKLLPFLAAVFPDNPRLRGTTLDVRSSFAVKKSAKALAKSTTPEGLIENVSTFLKAMSTTKSLFPAKAQGEGEDGDEDMEAKSATKRILMHDLGKGKLNAVYRRLLCIYGGVVTRSYLFACTEMTTESELANFLERVDAFPTMKFALLEANRLSMDLKDYLLRWVQERFEREDNNGSNNNNNNSNDAELGELHLIFTGSSGRELFSFLERVKVNDEAGTEARVVEAAGLQKRIESIKVYKDAPLSGKSYQIEQAIMAHDRSIVISVNEQFTATLGIRALREALQWSEVKIVMDVSPYAPLDVFGHFMYDFTVLGVISDPQTGEMYACPPLTKINLYIEVHAAPPNDDECSFTEVADVLEMIPLLRCCTKSYSTAAGSSSKDTSLAVTDELKLAAVAHAYRVGELPFDVDSFLRCTSRFCEREFVSSRTINTFLAFMAAELPKDAAVTTQAKYIRFFAFYCEALRTHFAHWRRDTAPSASASTSAKALFDRAMDGIVSVMRQYASSPLKRVTRCLVFPASVEPAILDFEEGSVSRARTDTGLEVVGLQDVLQRPELLTDLMDNTFKTTLSKELMDQRGYVLTPDFALKFMVIENCRAAGQNVVLSGDTGTGKSELIDIYSLLVNLRCGSLPVPLRVLMRMLLKGNNNGSNDYDSFLTPLENISNVSEFYNFVNDVVATKDITKISKISSAVVKLVTARVRSYDSAKPRDIVENVAKETMKAFLNNNNNNNNSDNSTINEERTYNELRELLKETFGRGNTMTTGLYGHGVESDVEDDYLNDYIRDLAAEHKSLEGSSGSSTLQEWVRRAEQTKGWAEKLKALLGLLADTTKAHAQCTPALVGVMYHLACSYAARVYEDYLYAKPTSVEQRIAEGKDDLRDPAALLAALPMAIDATGSCVIPRGFEEFATFLRTEAYPAVAATGDEGGSTIGETKESVLRFVECEGGCGGERFAALCDWVGRFVARHVRRYRLVVPSALMRSTAEWWLTRSGDSPLATVDDVKAVLADTWNERMETLFHKIQMHQHITPEAFVRLVSEVDASARRANKIGNSRNSSNNKDNEITVIGFIDECTSSSVMGMVKEVLVDNKLNGKPLARNIMWIGAFNYNAVNAKAKVSAGDFINLDTGLAALSEEVSGNLDFAVRPPPPSLRILEVEFNPMLPEQQSHFIKLLIKLRSTLDSQSIGRDPASLAQTFETLSFSHLFLKEANQHRIHPSIRDLIRSVDLYTYFRTHPAYYTAGGAVTEQERHFYSLVLALSFCYYFRTEPKARAKYAAQFAEAFPALISMEKEIRGVAAEEGDLFYNVFREVSMKLYRHTGLLEGVAPTDSFLQNLLMTVTCIDAKIPLIIMGPPGCSKTLSFTVATGNMKGPRSHMDFYKGLSEAHPIRYQCSKDSADTEIEEVYKNARERQEEDDNLAAEAARAAAAATEGDNKTEVTSIAAGPGARCVVLLDEAGLPDERKAPLKVLHYMLDHPRVPSIILTNKVLDAAKTNRAALLLQSAPSESDLACLAETCIYEGNAGSADRGVTGAVAHAYTRIIEEQDLDGDDNKITTVPNYYHLRDFVYLLRYLGRVVNVEHGNPTDPPVLVRALQRNFGGTTKDRFTALAAIFAEEIAARCITRKVAATSEEEEAKKYVVEVQRLAAAGSPIDALRDSLREEIRDKHDPNSAPFRYVMVIDPSDSEVSLSLLSSLGLCNPKTTRFCRVTNFGNNWEKARTDSIISVKDAMETGKTVVLVNPLAISSSFYDVLNRHFEVFVDEESSNNSHGNNDNEEERYQYFAHVAIGSSSQPCSVSPNFRLIVHLPYSALKKTPAPFLNRFEKYYLSLGSDIDDKLAAMSPAQRLAVACLRRGCNNMLRTLHGEQFFYGLVPEETVNSLLKPVIDHMREHNEKVPVVEPPFKEVVSATTAAVVAAVSQSKNKEEMEVEDENENEEGETLLNRSGSIDGIDDGDGESMTIPSDSNNEEEEEEEEEEENGQIVQAIRMLNYHIFQLARPECVFGEKRLPKKYLREYLINQEHFSIAEHMGHVMSRAGQRGVPTKWCIFTRSCSELSRLHSDSGLQNKLFSYAACGDSLTYSVFSLQTIKSIEECDAVVNAARDKDVLVCVADMQTCNSDQINYVRTQISSLQRQREVAATTTTTTTAVVRTKAFFVILHFPPELQLLRSMSSGQGMFVNGWEFTFIDNFGLTVESNESQASIKKWLFHVFGLRRNESITSTEGTTTATTDSDDDNDNDSKMEDEENEVTTTSNTNSEEEGDDVLLKQEEVQSYFRARLVEKILEVCKRTKPPGLKGQHLSKKVKDLYTSKGIKNLRNTVDSFMKANPAVVDKYVARIINIWCTKLLNEVLRKGCADIQQGRRSTGFVQLITDTLGKFFLPGAAEFVRILCCDYGLEAVLRVNEPGHEAERVLVEKVMSRAPICMMNDLCRKIAEPETSNTLGLTALFRTPSYLPLFWAVAKRVEEVIASARKGESGRDCRSLAALAKELTESRRSRHAMDNAVAHIEATPALLRWYKRDFVVRVAGLLDLYVARRVIEKAEAEKAVWLDACARCIECLTDGHPNSVLYFHLVPHFYKREIAYFAKAVAPLRSLVPVPTEFLGALSAINFASIEDIARGTLRITVDIFYRRLLAQVEASNGCDDSAICNVVEAFREFRCKFPFRSYVVHNIFQNTEESTTTTTTTAIYGDGGDDGGNVLGKMDILYVVQFFLLNVGSALASASDSGDVPQGALLSAVRRALSVTVAAASDDSGIVRYSGSLEKALGLCRVLVESLLADPAVAELKTLITAGCTSLVRAVARYFVEYEPVEDVGAELPEYLMRDVRHLFRMCLANNATVAGSEWVGKKSTAAIWALETVGWILKTKPPAWTAAVVDVLTTEFAAGESLAEVDLLDMTPKSLGTAAYISYQLQLQARSASANNSSDDDDDDDSALFEGTLLSRAAAVKGFLSKLAQALVERKDDEPEVAEMCERFFRLNEKSKELHNIELALFTSFKSSRDAANVCYFKAVLDRLGLTKEYFVPESQRIGTIFLPPYILFKEHPLHALYREVCALAATGDPSNFARGVRDIICEGQANMPYIVNALRMMLIAVAYYEFFLDSRECPAIRGAVPHLCGDLHIATNLEERAFLFFTQGHYSGSGSSSGRDDDDGRADLAYDPLLNTFATLGQSDSTTCTIGHALASVLAFTMGCPANGTHMYERIFRMHDMNDSYGPGATYQRLNQDCGYQYNYGRGADTETLYDGYPPIMHDNMAYRAALNATVWLAFSLALLIDRSAIGEMCSINRGHCLNYLQDDEFYRTESGTNIRRDRDANVRTYVYNRGSLFCTLFDLSPKLAEKQIDGLHFINLFLMELFNVTNEVDGTPKPAALKGHYATEQEAIAYENAVELIFDRIMGDYQKQKAAAKQVNLSGSCKGMMAIFDANARVAATVQCPLALSLDTFRDTFAHIPQGISPFITQFVGSIGCLRTMRHTAAFARFYVGIVDALDYRITGDELNELTVVQALQKYDRSNTLLAYWDDLKRDWEPTRAVMYGIFGNEDVWRHPITDSTIVGTLVGSDSNLFKALDSGFSVIQERLIKIRDEGACKRWNPLGLGWRGCTSASSDDTIDPNALLTDIGTEYNIITGETYPGEFLGYILSEMVIDQSCAKSSIRFNYDLIAKHFVWAYMSEARRFGNFTESFRRRLHLSVEAEADDSPEDLFMSTFDTMHGVTALKKATARLAVHSLQNNDNLAVSNPIIAAKKASVALLSQPLANPQKLDRILGEYGESALICVAEYLVFVAREALLHCTDTAAIEILARTFISDLYRRGGLAPFLNKDDANEEVSEIEDNIDMDDDSGNSSTDIPKPLVPFTKFYCMNLMALSENVLRRIEEKQYLFRSMESHYKLDISPDEQKFLDTFRARVNNIKDPEVARLYSDALSEIFEIFNVFRSHLLPDVSIKEAFGDDLHRLSKEHMKICDELLPPTKPIMTSSYARFMGWMNIVIGELASKTSDCSALYSKDDAKEGGLMSLSSSTGLLSHNDQAETFNLEAYKSDDSDFDMTIGDDISVNVIP